MLNRQLCDIVYDFGFHVHFFFSSVAVFEVSICERQLINSEDDRSGDKFGKKAFRKGRAQFKID